MSAPLTLFFEPLDVLQFRDARPFDAGLHVLAHSMFPLPSVFVGAVRTALLRRLDVALGTPQLKVPPEWLALLGDHERPATFVLRGPLLARRACQNDRTLEPLFPAPADLYRAERDDYAVEPPHREYRILTPRQPHGFTRWRWEGGKLAAHTSDVPWTPHERDKHDGQSYWLTAEGARVYLAHDGPGPIALAGAHVRAERCISEREFRTGIARNNGTLTTREGLFYVTMPFRLRSDATGTYGFAVDITLPDDLGALAAHDAERALRDLDGAVVPLGGRAHRAVVRVSDGPLLPDDLTRASAPLPRGVRRKTWLVAPLPRHPEASAPSYAVASRSVPVGGFDLARRAPRPLQLAWPAGTVLVTDDDVRASLPDHQRSMGYGTALVKALEGEDA